MTDSHCSVSLDQSGFDRFAGRLARELGADVILSEPDHPSATVSLAGIRPVAELVFSKNTKPDEVRRFCFESPGLALGFISYTYGLGLRGVTTNKQLSFPPGHIKKYAAVVEYDAEAGLATVSCDDAQLAEKIMALAHGPAVPVTPVTLPGPPPAASLDQAAYEDGVRETLERILSGHTYQLNLSTRFTWDCPDLDPLSLFLTLRRRHPAPFYAWITSGPHRIISTSPERFLRVQDGEVLSQPIKGTLRFDAYAPDLIEQLTGSPKESAELSMIVDLIRNDISADCEYGSVRVTDHKSVFRVDNLLQMYSNVHGRLREGRDCLDLFFNAFPGGSVTGCPKHSSMAIIEELEPHSRDVYCGSVVVIRDEQTMDSSIAIRTGTYDTDTGKLRTYAGSGIVVDSNPTREYQETVAKAEKFLTLGGK